MVSDERRRYDAQMLRNEGFAEGLGDDHGIIDSPEDAGELMLRVLDVICDYRDGLHYYPNFFEGKAVTELLADLIDRPTAKQEHNGAYWRCSHCGAFTRKDAVVVDGLDVVPLRYCGNCGREWE